MQEYSPYNPDRMRRGAAAAENNLERSDEFSASEYQGSGIGIRLSRKKAETLSSQEATDSLEATGGVSQDSTVSLDSQGVPKNWGKLLGKKPGKGCHLCGMGMARTDKWKKCHCGNRVHRDCFRGNADICPSAK